MWWIVSGKNCLYKGHIRMITDQTTGFRTVYQKNASIPYKNISVELSIIRCGLNKSNARFFRIFFLIAGIFLLQPKLITADPGKTELLATSENGETNFISMQLAAKEMEAIFTFDSLTGTGTLEKDEFRIVFKVNAPCYSFDGNLRLLDPVTENKCVPFITNAAAKTIREYFIDKIKEKKSRFRIAAIVIDAGHGGKDPGAIGEYDKKNRIAEKDITLITALRLSERLKSAWPDRTIILTRDDDKSISLEERVAKANDIKLDDMESVIYISIHANASFNKNAKGFEVWYLDPDLRREIISENKARDMDPSVRQIVNTMLEEAYTTESYSLAKFISGCLEKAVGDITNNRGIRAEKWFVVRNAKMPSILIELGFVTEKDEAALLSDKKYLFTMADAVYNGVTDFIRKIESSGGTGL